MCLGNEYPLTGSTLTFLSLDESVLYETDMFTSIHNLIQQSFINKAFPLLITQWLTRPLVYILVLMIW